MKDVLILGIESSCDETCCSVVRNGREILSNIIYSQADFHEEYGGVVPELASRMHVEAISTTYSKAIKESGVALSDIDGIAVTYGPGLVGALLVGLSFAKGLAYANNKPLIGVNHLQGHIAANYLCFKELEPPFLCLLVSGGNTQIVKVNDYTDIEIIGRTRDDAAGEAIDKISRVIGLGYPGGPKLDKVGQGGDSCAFSFSRTHMGDTLDFSFSGIKTSALNEINQYKQKGEDINISDFAASYLTHISDILIKNLLKASDNTSIKTVCLAGGVSANSFLRRILQEKAANRGLKIYYPSLGLCTDNAAMIASAGYYEYLKGTRHDIDLNAYPSLRIKD